MKKLLIAAGITGLFACNITHAQEIYGTVTYKSKITAIELSDEVLAETPADQVDETKASVIAATEQSYTLDFDKNSSYYKKIEKPDQGDMLIINADAFDAEHYLNLKENKAVMQLTVLDETYLLANTLRNIKWNQEKEVKKIAGYNCKKATYTRPEDNSVVTAWYTPDIPVSLGPESYWGLPGLILEIEQGNSVLQCTNVTLKPAKKPVISPPAKGRKVTKDELLEIFAKKQAEFQPVIQEVPAEGQNIIIAPR